MKQLVCGALAFAWLASACPSAFCAGLFRAYLSSDGSDESPCTLAAPCRLLPAAIAAVDEGGEIWLLDSANYNTATVQIAKSATILSVPGVTGSVLAASGPALVVNAGITVTLRNLRIVPLAGGTGTRGIEVNGATKFTLEESVVVGLPGVAVYVSGPTLVQITACTIRDNGDAGVYLMAGAAAEISAVNLTGNAGPALLVEGSVTATTTSATVSDSLVSGSPTGILVNAAATGAKARAAIARSIVADNAVGLSTVAADGATALSIIGYSMVTGNSTGLYQNGAGAVLESAGNNIVRHNTTPTSGTITTVPTL